MQRYVPEFEKRWSRYARPVGDSWRVDETYLKIRGQWVYLYRAVDKAGRTVDFLLSRRRDMAAATRFFSKAIKPIFYSSESARVDNQRLTSARGSVGTTSGSRRGSQTL